MTGSASFVAVTFALLASIFVTLVQVTRQTCEAPSEGTVKFKSASTTVDGKIDNVVFDESSFNALWPDLKEKLCPNMVPNLALGATIFALARDELGMEPWSAEEEQKLAASRFFTFNIKPAFTYTSPEKDKTVYLTIWKAGNDQIRYGTEELMKDKPGTFLSRDDQPKLVNVDVKHFFSSEGNLCIVTAVRDPVSHFLSGYNEEETRCCLDKTPPSMTKTKHLYTRYASGTTQRFEEFVADFVGGMTDDSFHKAYVHFYSMTGWLTALAKWDLKLTSYLPTLNNLTETWMPFVNSTCPGIPKSSVRPMKKYKEHHSQSDPGGFYKAAKEVWAAQGATARALCALHVMDYSCYDRLPEGVPNLCRNVFGNPRVAQKIDAALASQ